MAIEPINTLYIPAFSIQELLNDKDTGLPLSGGVVTFYRDNQRISRKQVFQISGDSPNYTFTSLGSQLELSSTGEFVDTFGNPVVPYFYPYDSEGEIDLYYVTVYSQDAVFQLAREAVPYVKVESDEGEAVANTTSNQISNPQFVEVLFDTYATNTVTYDVAGSQVTPIAPGWDLVTTGTGTVTVTWIDSLSATTPSVPSYALQFSSAGLTTAYQIRQRFEHSPNLFYGEYVSSSFVALTPSVTSLVVSYVPSAGGNNVTLNEVDLTETGSYTTYSAITLINGPVNTDNSEVGYVDILLTIQPTVMVAVTSFQLLTVVDGTVIPADVVFEQESSARQVDHLFHYYSPILKYKPIPSYLVGWDFPLNPAQALGSSVSATTLGAANLSYYVWDQTILFQSVDASVSVARRSTTGGIEFKCTGATSSFAVIQYLPQKQAREILADRIAVALRGVSDNPTPIKVTVSLYYTTDAALPVLQVSPYGSPSYSLVSAVNATTGVPTVGGGGNYGNWVKVERSESVATFNLSFSNEDYYFNGWDDVARVGADTATFFAIVIGFSQLTSAATPVIVMDYCSLMAGDVATRPAPQTTDEVLRECQYYYESSYNLDVVPGAATQQSSAIFSTQIAFGSPNGSVYPAMFSEDYSVVKRTNNPSLSLYSASSGAIGTVEVELISAGSVVGAGTNATVSTSWNQLAIGSKGSKGYAFIPDKNSGAAIYTAVGGGSSPQNGYISYHYTADARLGVVA